MAQAFLNTSKLRLVFEARVDENGKTVYKAKTLSNIKKEASTEQLFQIAQAIAAPTPPKATRPLSPFFFLLLSSSPE